MSDLRSAGLDRRRFLAVGGVVGAGAVLAACTSNEPDTPAAETNGQAAATAGDNAAPGKKVTIGFSGPAGRPRLDRRDHQQRQGAGRDVLGRDVQAGRGGATRSTQQIASIETLIAKKPDVMVMLPHDGKELNAFGLKAMEAGIPVVNLDRAFPDAAGLPAADQGRQLRHGRRGRGTTSASSSRPRASATR